MHWWDYTTSIEEVIDSLDALVQQGTALGIRLTEVLARRVACLESVRPFVDIGWPTNFIGASAYIPGVSRCDTEVMSRIRH